MKRIAAIVFSAIILCVSVFSVSAVNYGFDGDTVSSAVYLENLSNNTVVYEKAADVKDYIMLMKTSYSPEFDSYHIAHFHNSIELVFMLSPARVPCMHAIFSKNFKIAASESLRSLVTSL